MPAVGAALAAATMGDWTLHHTAVLAAAPAALMGYCALRCVTNKPALQALARSIYLVAAAAGWLSSYCAPWCPALALLPIGSSR